VARRSSEVEPILAPRAASWPSDGGDLPLSSTQPAREPKRGSGARPLGRRGGRPRPQRRLRRAFRL